MVPGAGADGVRTPFFLRPSIVLEAARSRGGDEYPKLLLKRYRSVNTANEAVKPLIFKISTPV